MQDRAESAWLDTYMGDRIAMAIKFAKGYLILPVDRVVHFEAVWN